VPLDPQIAAILAARSQAPRHAVPVAQLRAALLAALPAKMPPVAHVRDLTVPSAEGQVPIRVYRPDGEPSGCVVFFHGGGFVMGNLDTHDPICRELCVGGQSVVVAADYRLAPEHPFPCALNDCDAVLQWVIGHSAELAVGPGRIIVCGDSAGGNLAAVLAIRQRNRGGPSLLGQALLYPVTDAPMPFKPSYIENGIGYSLTRDDMIRFWRDYTGDGEANGPETCPLRASSLSRLPTTLILTAEFDPLRDEGEAYAARLAQFRVPTTLTRYDGAIHGFIRLGTDVGLAKEALQQVSRWMKDRYTQTAMRES
jgi:acetyl esterase/lipase